MCLIYYVTKSSIIYIYEREEPRQLYILSSRLITGSLACAKSDSARQLALVKVVTAKRLANTRDSSSQAANPRRSVPVFTEQINRPRLRRRPSSPYIGYFPPANRLRSAVRFVSGSLPPFALPLSLSPPSGQFSACRSSLPPPPPVNRRTLYCAIIILDPRCGVIIIHERGRSSVTIASATGGDLITVRYVSVMGAAGVT